MKRNNTWKLIGILMLAIISSSCHLEQGKLYFDEVGLDPITVYKMAPLERTVYCLTEADGEVGPDFERMHAAALEKVRNNPEHGDWSELVCLSLSGEINQGQLRQTVDTLDLVLSVQPQQSNPVRGFKRIMEMRLALYAQLDKKRMQVETLKQKNVEQATALDRYVKKHEHIQNEQRKKIGQLEQQVRKLKEIELLLHPKQ